MVISGQPESVQAAETALKAVLSAREEEQREEEVVTLALPHYAVGRVIGRQGGNVRSLQRESGARIEVARGSSSDEGEQECRVTGSREQIARAVALLREAVLRSDVSRGCRVMLAPATPPGGEAELKPCKLPEGGAYFAGFVSAVDAAGHVWVQVVEGGGSTSLDLLVANMTEHYSKVVLVWAELVRGVGGASSCVYFVSPG